MGVSSAAAVSGAVGGGRGGGDGTEETVLGTLGERRRAGDGPGGAQVSQEDLAARLGVSRTPVREALRVLANEGLVTVTKTGRTIVAPIDPQEIQEHFEIRARLETWMLSLAIPVLTDQDTYEAEQLLEELQTADDADWSELNLAFHRLLYRPANRPAMLEMVDQIYRKISRRLSRTIYGARDTERSMREHREILSLCVARDVQGATDRLESHIMRNGQAVVDRLRAIAARA